MFLCFGGQGQDLGGSFVRHVAIPTILAVSLKVLIQICNGLTTGQLCNFLVFAWAAWAIAIGLVSASPVTCQEQHDARQRLNRFDGADSFLDFDFWLFVFFNRRRPICTLHCHYIHYIVCGFVTLSGRGCHRLRKASGSVAVTSSQIFTMVTDHSRP